MNLQADLGIKAPDKRGIHILFFLFFHENICCGYSLEVPRCGASNEYHNIRFCGEIRKISTLFVQKIGALSRAMRNTLVTCHKADFYLSGSSVGNFLSIWNLCKKCIYPVKILPWHFGVTQVVIF